MTECLVITSSEFQRLFDDEPGLRQYVMELHARRLAGLASLVAEVAFDRVDRRLAGFLLDQAAKDSALVRIGGWATHARRIGATR